MYQHLALNSSKCHDRSPVRMGSAAVILQRWPNGYSSCCTATASNLKGGRMISNDAGWFRACSWWDDWRRLADGDYRWLVVAAPTTLIIYVNVLGDDRSVGLSASCTRTSRHQQDEWHQIDYKPPWHVRRLWVLYRAWQAYNLLYTTLMNARRMRSPAIRLTSADKHCKHPRMLCLASTETDDCHSGMDPVSLSCRETCWNFR